MRKFFAVGLLFWLAGCGEAVDESYATWAEAREAGAIEKGWIPSFVPPTARDLRDRHDLDTNAQRLTFSAPPSDTSKMVRGLRPVTNEDADAASRLAHEIKWNSEKAPIEAYLVCSQLPLRNPWAGAVLVERATGRAMYQAPVDSLEDDCKVPAQAVRRG